MKSLIATIALSAILALPAAAQTIGERPALETHLDQDLIESGEITVQDCFDQGRVMFNARFNALDGLGRPASTGSGQARTPDQPEFIRTSGPEANSCFGCHNQPSAGGSGEFVVNVFTESESFDPVIESISADFSNERNTVGMFGAGPIEMLAREMSTDLQVIRDDAIADAQTSGVPVTSTLVTKGVNFGTITAMPDGKIDPTGIVGVDWDLIIKPFHQKGAVVSIRQFTNNAMNRHHGMQSAERFGEGQDDDGDGFVNELTLGDITAVTLFQAALGTPTVVIPTDPARRTAGRRGSGLFNTIGCNTCHIPSMILNDPNFTEPNPFNPTGNLTPEQVNQVVTFDMTVEGLGPRLRSLSGGRARVSAYTDLKRHNLNDEDFNHFANEQVPQGDLVGFASEDDFTIDPLPRPTEEFLTRKLWDAGNSDPYGHRGDLSTLTEAIFFHGGEARESRDAFFALPQDDQNAVVEFLKALQVLPDTTGI
jgi:cytochrome c peroxidase